MPNKKPSPKEGKTKRPRVESPRPATNPPRAVVVSRHGTEMATRTGRGFSLWELRAAGVPVRLATAWGAPIDIRRRTSLDDNVRALRGWAATPEKAGKKELEKIEEEVVKVEREVVEEVTKEAAKVKRGAKKVGRELETAAEKPARARRKKKAATGRPSP